MTNEKTINLEKPKIKLISLEKTAVNTQTQEEYDTLMRIYECGGRSWSEMLLPTEDNYWVFYEERTCINAEVNHFENIWEGIRDEFKYGSRKFYEKKGCKIISLNEFCNKQKISQNKRKGVNKYFENKK